MKVLRFAPTCWKIYEFSNIWGKGSSSIYWYFSNLYIVQDNLIFLIAIACFIIFVVYFSLNLKLKDFLTSSGTWKKFDLIFVGEKLFQFRHDQFHFRKQATFIFCITFVLTSNSVVLLKFDKNKLFLRREYFLSQLSNWRHFVFDWPFFLLCFFFSIQWRLFFSLFEMNNVYEQVLA